MKDIVWKGDRKRYRKAETRHKKGFCLLWKLCQAGYSLIHPAKQYLGPQLWQGIPWYTPQRGPPKYQRHTNLLPQQTTPILIGRGRKKWGFYKVFLIPPNRMRFLEALSWPSWYHKTGFRGKSLKRGDSKEAGRQSKVRPTVKFLKLWTTITEGKIFQVDASSPGFLRAAWGRGAQALSRIRDANLEKRGIRLWRTEIDKESSRQKIDLGREKERFL